MTINFRMNIFKYFLTGTLLLTLALSACTTKPATTTMESAAPVSQSTEAPTTATEVPTHNSNGTTVYFKAELPQTPATIEVYTARDEQLATVDSVKALAE